MGKIKGKIAVNSLRRVETEKKQRLIFSWILVILAMLLYYNTIFNYFSLDDNYINISNEQNVQGIRAIPEIFTTLYSDNGEQAYGYRALTRATFALEYQFTANSPYNPYISHGINLLLYILAALILFRVLNRLLREYNPWFAFLIVVLFIAHPTHTEVVASIKNRDILLHFIFAFLAIMQFIRWVDRDKTIHLIIGMFYFLLALISKETAIVEIAVFPLVLYFFTDISKKRLIAFVGISLGIIVLVFGLRMLLLPATNRVYSFMENPLVFETNFVKRIATGFYGLGFYLKLLIIPFPLLYYYGYNMVPIVGFNNVWVIFSAIVYVGLFIIAIINLKEKKLISFVILFFLVHLSMYANFVKPVPGIVADRFVFFASLSFAMALVWGLFILFKVKPTRGTVGSGKITGLVLVVLAILIPYGYYVHYRNTQWKTLKTLFEADMNRLDNSVKANNLYASDIISRVNKELAKPVNPYKFVIKMINKAEEHFLKAVALDSSHVASINSLGVIYSRIHGNQALIREKGYKKQDRLEDAEKARQESVDYFKKAIGYFHDALKFDPKNGSSFYNLGNTYEMQQQWDSATYYYQKEIEADGPTVVSMSRLSNMYYKSGDIRAAIQENEKLIQLFPDSYQPYINLGNYAFVANDTTSMLSHFEKAVKLGAGGEVSGFLASYYHNIGDTKNAAYYQDISTKAVKNKK
ncbi:MAG: DUF1736 domain-containing protein [Bacteroidetes bacterium]|nr:DUF1736 domain-containing protein [Bacteroidota bacterium]